MADLNHDDCWQLVPLAWKHLLVGDVIDHEGVLYYISHVQWIDDQFWVKLDDNTMADPVPANDAVMVLTKYTERESLLVLREQLGAKVQSRHRVGNALDI